MKKITALVLVIIVLAVQTVFAEDVAELKTMIEQVRSDTKLRSKCWKLRSMPWNKNKTLSLKKKLVRFLQP